MNLDSVNVGGALRRSCSCLGAAPMCFLRTEGPLPRTDAGRPLWWSPGESSCTELCAVRVTYSKFHIFKVSSFIHSDVCVHPRETITKFKTINSSIAPKASRAPGGPHLLLPLSPQHLALGCRLLQNSRHFLEFPISELTLCSFLVRFLSLGVVISQCVYIDPSFLCV